MDAPPPPAKKPKLSASSPAAPPRPAVKKESALNKEVAHILVAVEIPDSTRGAPSKVEKEAVPISEADLASGKPYNIMPIVPVQPCKNPRLPPADAHTHPTEDILGWDSQHNYVQRWVRMAKEEYNQNVKFEVVKNDSTRESLLMLLGLKNVFVKQLPNMPRPYVSRLVFDRKHESLALLKKSGNDYVVMGGCCYRPFPDQKFAEIAFLAISQTEQIRGYGTRLMAQTKERAKQLELTHLLTCADNHAVPYFKKQGFSRKITLPFDLWQGYIKDYDGVTLMECILHPKVDYLNIPMLLKAQKMALVEKMKEISNSHVVYPGIDVEARKGIKIEDIPGLKDVAVKNGASSTRSGPAAGLASRDKTSLEILHKHLQSVLDEVKNHDCAWPFLEPVNAKETGAIDYYDVIKNPMDLSTMQERLDNGWFYVTKEIFIADFKRMVTNCKTYNGKGHYVTDMAIQLEKLFMNKV
ncbi:Histone acetyltransferase GCN5 [Gracilariopsis chorda]|uniref:histone acetyltransferase n=1 Tax=Gracilariopsis chorda TaxID=448386 RepID=A0A2V3IXZ9_9FLOR|nr:Histone acetyltransferase GCN5 [Gracilariopsis chorda]|eukprot:PXF46557.1 Histone acetyltransferase GCN5 [Gracilariopsis chorda]